MPTVLYEEDFNDSHDHALRLECLRLAIETNERDNSGQPIATLVAKNTMTLS